MVQVFFNYYFSILFFLRRSNVEVIDISNDVEEIAYQLSLQNDVQFFERRDDRWVSNDQIDQCQMALVNNTHVADAARVSKLISWANI